jgi:hypothetical protein
MVLIVDIHGPMGNASILDRSRQIVEPMAIANQPRPMLCYKLSILLLLKHYTRNIVKYWEITSLPSIYDLPNTSFQRMVWLKMSLSQHSGCSGHYIVISTVLVKLWSNNGTGGCTNPTKTSTCLPSIYDLPNTSFQRMVCLKMPFSNDREVLTIA